MRELNAEGQRVVRELAQRHGVSADAVSTLLRALVAGSGSMAQFSHPELGGMGQWSQGGMIMVGDMFNQGLKARVDGLCSELAAALRAGKSVAARAVASQSQCQDGVQPVRAGRWLVRLVAGRTRPAQLDRRAERCPLCLLPGRPPARDRARRPAHGLRHRRPPDRRCLPAAGRRQLADLHQPAWARPRRRPADRPRAGRRSRLRSHRAHHGLRCPSRCRQPLAVRCRRADDVLDKIERLAALRQKGILTEEEFTTKKGELLSRL